MAILAPAIDLDGPFWLARILDTSNASETGEIKVKYYQKKGDNFVAGHIATVDIGSLMGPATLDQDNDEFYLDEDQQSHWTTTANMSRNSIKAAKRTRREVTDYDFNDATIDETVAAVAATTTTTRAGRIRNPSSKTLENLEAGEFASNGKKSKRPKMSRK